MTAIAFLTQTRRQSNRGGWAQRSFGEDHRTREPSEPRVEPARGSGQHGKAVLLPVLLPPPVAVGQPGAAIDPNPLLDLMPAFRHDIRGE